MSTPSQTVAAASESSAAAPAGSLARTVAEDLEALFPHPSGRAPAAGPRRVRRRRDPAGLARAGAGRVGSMIAVGLVGMFAGALATRGLAPGLSAHLQRFEGPRIETVESGLPLPGPLAPGPLLVAGPSQALQARAAPSPSKLRQNARRQASEKRRAAPCKGTACASPVMAADARLRRAYYSAAGAGVPRDVLVDYRDEWEDLQRRARRDPRTVATRYDEMAHELRRMATRESSVAERPANPLRRLGAQLEALLR